MSPRSSTRIRLALFALLLGAGATGSLARAEGPGTNPGTLSYIPTPVTIPAPLGLTEVSPGNFVGLQDGSPTFLLTSQGAITVLCQIPANEVVSSVKAVQAVNGRLYGSGVASQGGKNVGLNFSFGLNCNPESYPNPFTPTLFVPTPDGGLFGTYFGDPAANAFVRMALDGTVTILHTFSSQEGGSAGPLVLADDGNFYGISGRFSKPAGNSSSVYRATPQGDLKILATFAQGSVPINAPPGEALIQASNGRLYGASVEGGSHRAGSIFELSLDGTGYKALYDYPYLASGIPTALAEGPDGNLYGIAQGESQLCACSTLFRISLQGKYQKLQQINPSVSGGCPCWMTLGSDGKFYGTAESGAWIWDLGLPGPTPLLTALQPASGPVGGKVIVWGKNLLGARAVSFNGTAATTLANISANFVSVTVPAGATSGPVTITTANGSAASPGSFTVE